MPVAKCHDGCKGDNRELLTGWGETTTMLRELRATGQEAAAYQDERYGSRRRVHTPFRRNDRDWNRCTVCGAEAPA